MQPIETRYKGYRFRSRLEARWAVFFEAMGVKWEYEKEGFNLDGVRYLPDFWINSWQAWIEIKPEVFEQQSRGHDLCIALSKAQPGRDVLLLSGSPWPDEHSVIVCNSGFTKRVGELMEINQWSHQFVGLAVSTPGETDWYPIASYDQPMLDTAFYAARSARFEHGETPK